MKPCCEQSENREVVEDQKDLRVERCKECGCRHFELTVDPGELGLKGATL